MSKKNNLFRQALAEASELKKTSRANEKLTVENQMQEAFSREWASMLRELNDPEGDGHGKSDGGDTDYGAVEEQTTLDSSEIGTGDNRAPDSEAKSSSNIDNPGQEVELFGEGAEVESDGHETVLNQLTEDDELDLEDEEDEDVSDIPVDGMDDDFDDDLEGEEDIDVEFGDDEGDIGGEDVGGDEEAVEAILAIADQLGISPDELADALEGQGEVEEDVSDFASRNPSEYSKPNVPDLAVGGEDENILRLEAGEVGAYDEALDEILRQMEAVNEQDLVTSLRSTVAKQKRALKEAHSVVRALHKTITEMNVQNSKLLFTNKLFKSYNLNPSDKVRVYESFDRVNTRREAELLYTTLSEVYKGTKPGNPSKRVMESIASMPIRSTKPKTVLNESAEDQATAKMRHRFQQISGILKD